ncbi:ABC transporter substrate-binding protein [Pseudidiomarina homiensis]|uniref:Fe/B12 periplasmic-binding domain-containing protein n=1 Tax=Pseudidiomarina homiensis TaxID=364198 RepID=A0A432XST8_9GAMM|nr:ABC transporter substrate-binding protein [Pseudidiomarina homiensis]RUO51787.1 hypothetical protein CWI70_12245 [Pseudidiomarina homiensis]
MVAELLLASVIVSLNPCFDDWLPQWLGEGIEVVTTQTHGQRLEAILLHEPDSVVAGSFVNRSLRLALEARVKLVTIPYVTTTDQWDAALQQLGQELQHETQLQHWRGKQRRQLQRFNLQALGEVLVLMPNAYTWGLDSWVAHLLQQRGATLSPLMGDGQLLRLSLEEVLLTQPDTVILEGFSSDYARAHDWLWHRAMQDWLTQRQVVEVNGAIAGCSDLRAVDYLKSIRSDDGAHLWGD